MIWKVPRVWEGEQCVIIGGGPSVIRQFNIPENLVNDVYQGRKKVSCYSPYLEPIHNQHVIAVNMAYRLGPWVDWMFFGDDSFWRDEQKELRSFKGLKISCAKKVTNNPEVKALKRDQSKPYGITTDPTKIMFNNNSGSGAINLAVHTGVKRIILLGFDMSMNDVNNQHWHKFYSTEPTFLKSTYRTQCYGFDAMVQDLKKLDIEVLNCNPESKVEGFPKVNFKDIKL